MPFSLVAVPVIVNREVRGVLYVGVHSPVRLGDKVIEEISMTARCVEQDFVVNAALRNAAAGKDAATGWPSDERGGVGTSALHSLEAADVG